MTKIYTKTGDQGETSLFTGERVSKSSPFVAALGDVDECNSSLGAVLSFMPSTEKFSEVRQQLLLIQNTLFDLGAALATPRSRAVSSKIDKTRFDHEGIELLERWIDSMERHLSPLRTFILPGGHPCGALLHLTRSICRRAERSIVPLQKNADLSENV